MRKRRLEDSDVKEVDWFILPQDRDLKFKAKTIKGEIKAVHLKEFDGLEVEDYFQINEVGEASRNGMKYSLDV